MTYRNRSKRGAPFLAIAAMLTGALVLAGCGGGDSTTDASTTEATTEATAETESAAEAPSGSREELLAALPPEAQEAAADIPDELLQLMVDVRESGPKELVWVDAGGEVHEGWSEAFLNDWETITGWTVLEAAPGLDLSTAAVQAQVDAGNTEWDVFAILDYGTAEKLAKEGYWEKLDYKYFDLASIPDVAFYSDGEGTLVQGGSTTTLPEEGYYVGASDYGIVIQWNTDKFPPEGDQPKSALDFFDTERFPGKRCAFNWAQFGGNLEFGAMADGVPFDEVYEYLSDPANVEKSLANFDAIYDDIVWSGSGADAIQFLLDGQCDLGITYNGRPALRVKSEPDLPVEISWTDGIINGGPFAIPRGAPNYEAALSVYAMSMLPSRQCAALNAIGYGVVLNDETFPSCLTEFGQAWAPNYEASAGVADPYFFSERPELEERWAEWQSSQ